MMTVILGGKASTEMEQALFCFGDVTADDEIKITSRHYGRNGWLAVI